MKRTLLFPCKLRYLGYLLAIPGLILGYMVAYQKYEIPGFELRIRENDSLFISAIENFTNELALTLVIVGLILVAFSKLKHEDELTGKIRLNALYWSILINYCFYTLFSLLSLFSDRNSLHIIVSGFLSTYVTFTIYNFFIPLVIFILRFYYLLYRNKNEYTIKQVHYLPNKPYLFIGKWVSLIIIAMLVVNQLFKLNIKWFETSFMLLPLSLLLWAYSKERAEDEYISTIRLEAMQIAVYVNYVILLISNMLVYGFDFLLIQMINLVTIPLIFIAWFQYRLYRSNQQAELKSALSS
ncbi:MAG: hypothetical protein ABIN91_13285 [Mucilaginibacter sp.]|uniref:hypothetical protein n=1 Tax=Mucilaginibacter sp. TaxID=1882438 RepID=UPI003263618D